MPKVDVADGPGPRIDLRLTKVHLFTILNNISC